MKTRPCRRSTDCPYPAMKGKQACGWHWLMKQPIDQQVKYAKARLAQTPEPERASRVPAERWPAGTRFCSGCQSMIPLFYASGSRCRACSSAASHGAAIEKKYGVTAERYEELYLLQGGRCAICRCVSRAKRLAVDHDHVTGEPRGLLCPGERGCNRGILGSAHDDIEILRAAVAYLEAPPTSGRWRAPSTTKPGTPREDAGPVPF